jgi:hypothetical protein
MLTFKFLFIFQAITSQNPILYCNFDGQTILDNLCGNTFCSATTGSATFGSVQFATVPNVIPNWYIADITSISNLWKT